MELDKYASRTATLIPDGLLQLLLFLFVSMFLDDDYSFSFLFQHGKAMLTSPFRLTHSEHLGTDQSQEIPRNDLELNEDSEFVFVDC